MEAILSICIVEDNDDLRDTLVDVLEESGHTVTAFSSAEELNDSWANDGTELLVADLNLPGEDGLTLVSRLKHLQPGLRVIIMSTRTAIDERVLGYDVGADIYLPKPVDGRELLAAVRSISRQLRSDTPSNTKRSLAGPVQVDTQTLHLRYAKGEAKLGAVEVSLLLALARAPEQRLEYSQLLGFLGQDVDDEFSRSNLAVKITRIRSRFRQLGLQGNLLKSLRGFGYQLCIPLEIR